MANTHGTNLRFGKLQMSTKFPTHHIFFKFFSWLLLSDSMHIVSLFAAQAAFYITKI